jgi:hypothetical protein
MGETKKMIKLKDILMERISDVVYHFTTTEAANNIIGTNRFRLSDAPVEPNVDPGRKYEDGYYMSVSRTKVEGYTRNTSNFQCYFVRFELDGTKLGNRYKGGAYNYYHGKHGDDEYEEYEDRIYSKDMYIPNAMGYIKRMDVDVSRKCLMGFKTEKLIKTAIKSGVPTFLYPSRDKWGQQSGGIEVKDLDGYKLFMQSIVK